METPRKGDRDDLLYGLTTLFLPLATLALSNLLVGYGDESLKK